MPVHRWQRTKAPFRADQVGSLLKTEGADRGASRGGSEDKCRKRNFTASSTMRIRKVVASEEMGLSVGDRRANIPAPAGQRDFLTSFANVKIDADHGEECASTPRRAETEK